MGRNNRKRRDYKKRAKDKRRSSKTTRKKDKILAPSFTMMHSPISELDDDDKKKLACQISQDSKEQYAYSLEKINTLLRKYDPYSLISCLASYGLTVGVGDQGVTRRDSDAPISQSHVEICQALLLQINPSDLEMMAFSPDIVQELWDNTLILLDAINYKHIEFDANADADADAETRALKSLQNKVRINTRGVRNWGYFSQVKSISKELYGHFDCELRRLYNFTVIDVINFFDKLMNRIEIKNSERLHNIKSFHEIKNKKEMIIKYHELIGATRDEAEEFISEIDIDHIPRIGIFTMLLSHYDLSLRYIYEFSPNDLSNEFDMDVNCINSILECFCIEVGAYEEHDTEQFHLDNPVWLRPIIKVATDKYYSAIPQVFFSFIIPSIEHLLTDIGKQAIAQRRSEFLEEKIKEIINLRFDESSTVSRVKWNIEHITYESDIITFIDSHVIIVEAKSGRISEPALRGAPDRLKKHIEDVLISPNLQSKRLAERIMYLKEHPDVDDKLRKSLPIDINDIHRIIRVSVSLEDLASIQSNMMQIMGTGWLPNDYDPCPTMTLADFQTIFDLFEHPIQIINYLYRRQYIERTIRYRGDELDLMGLYISTLFNLGDVDDDYIFMISGMSYPLDVYYNSMDAGVVTKKPLPMVSKLFNDIIDQLERRKIPRWSEIGIILSMFSPDDQRKLSDMVRTATRNVKLNWHRSGHKNTIVITPPKASKYALCYILYTNGNASDRDNFIHNGVNLAFEADHVIQCLVIAKNIDRDDLHYHFIGLMERNDDNS